MIGLGVAHEEHGSRCRLGGLQDLPTHPERVVVQAKLHRVSGIRVHYRVEHQTRLLGLVVRGDGFIPVQLPGPDLVLALDERLVACAQGLQAVGRDHLTQDDVAGP